MCFEADRFCHCAAMETAGITCTKLLFQFLERSDSFDLSQENHCAIGKYVGCHGPLHRDHSAIDRVQSSTGSRL